MPSPFQVVQVVPSISAVASTASVGTPVDCTGWQALSVTLSVTSGIAVAASISSFRVWLQGQIPGSAAWSDLILPYVGKSFGVSSTAAVYTISGGLTQALSLTSEAVALSSTLISYTAKINAPPPYVRAAWSLVAASGAPFITFQIDGVLSQTVSV